MTGIQCAIWDYLNQFERPVRRSRLHNHLLKLGFAISDSRMRGEVQIMTETEGLLGSTHKGKDPGYYVIRSMDQARLAAKERRAKAYTELKIANTIEEKAALRFGARSTLFEIAEASK